MTKKTSRSLTELLPLFILAFGILARLLPHPANVAPITAIALFSAVHLPKKYRFILPIAALFLSDLFIGFYGAEMFFVYGSFLLSGEIGVWARQQKSMLMILPTALAASFSFFIITNFGVWLTGSLYSKDLAGLVTCFIAAAPFFRNTLIGDFFYTAVFFGGYAVLQWPVKIVANKKYRLLPNI